MADKKQLEFLEILKTGLGSTPGAGRRHVIIVGAGIAGLTSGMLLKEAGHKVTILEAQNRLGGRVLTNREFAGDMYGEFGAMRFPRGHELVSHLIHERFGLETEPFPMDNNLIYMQNQVVRHSDFRSDMFDFDLHDNERDVEPAKILKDSMAPLIAIMEDYDEDAAWGLLLLNYDKYSLIGFLKERGLSDGAIAMIGPLYNLEGRYHFSLLEWFAHYYDEVMGELEFITGGADSLPRAFGPMLTDDIKFGAEVHAITQNPKSISVHCTTSAATSFTVTGDECIVTAPLMMLRHMEIGGLDARKAHAIRNSYYGKAHKIFMQFSSRWWEESYDIKRGQTVTDLAIRNVVYPPAGQDRSHGKGVIIASYCWEQDSVPYNALPEEERMKQALEDLTKIHPEARSTYEFGVSKDWGNDRYAGGIGPLFRPFEMTADAFLDVIRPVNRVWFANDACDRRHRRWAEGAIRAAIRNSYAIHVGMRNEVPWAGLEGSAPNVNLGALA
jgi:monoamine oxidase